MSRGHEPLSEASSLTASHAPAALQVILCAKQISFPAKDLSALCLSTAHSVLGRRDS